MSDGKEQIKVYGVSELTDVIKGLFKRFDKIYVEGEISGWKVYASGHAYFTVKDENAQLSCVMFSSAIARCKAASRLKDGAKVCLYGRIDVYAPRGTYQMVVLAAPVFCRVFLFLFGFLDKYVYQYFKFIFAFFFLF